MEAGAGAQGRGCGDRDPSPEGPGSAGGGTGAPESNRSEEDLSADPTWRLRPELSEYEKNRGGRKQVSVQCLAHLGDSQPFFPFHSRVFIQFLKAPVDVQERHGNQGSGAQGCVPQRSKGAIPSQCLSPNGTVSWEMSWALWGREEQ